MSLIKNKINEQDKIKIQIQILNEDLENVLNESKKYSKSLPNKTSRNDYNKSPKSFIANFLSISNKNTEIIDIENYVYNTNNIKEIAFLELSEKEKQEYLWYPIANRKKAILSNKMISIEYVFYKKPLISIPMEYHNIYLESPNSFTNNNHFLSVMKYIFNTIVRKKCYSIPDSNI